MKTDSNKVASGQWPEAGVEQLLADVEHAGRDERRRQELGDMIDRMAGESGQWPVASGQKGHGFWWWGARVAAAACVLFFIGTAVRVWFIPTGESATVVAAAEVPVAVPVAVDSTPAATTVVAPTPRRTYARPQVAVTEPVILETPVVVEEYVAEEVKTAEPAAMDTDTVPAYIILDDFAPDAELIVQTVEPEPVAEPVTVAAEPAKPARRRPFFSLFRPAEPSLMEGTTLALLQF